MFSELKNEIIELIDKNRKKEITSKTNFKKSGIYIFYVDDFKDDKIIPFYIGQTKNFQKRYQQHYSELMALNRFEYETYKEYLFNNFYDGEYRACKVFKYMVEHKCTLKDFHMLILEDVPENKLFEKEQEYFEKYLPAFFGFNQMNTISLKEQAKSNIISRRQLMDYILKDSVNLDKFWEYGYNKFNYLIGFPKKILETKMDVMCLNC